MSLAIDAPTVWRNPWVRLALVIWVVMTFTICVRSVVQGHRQSLLPVWQLAGQDWLTSHDLYDKADGHPIRSGYRYSPLCAIVFVPFDLMPQSVGNVVCRLINAVVFLYAVYWWLKHAVPGDLSISQRGLIFALMAPIALGSLNNGQVNLLMMGLILICLTAVHLERWNLAAWTSAFAVLLKIYPIAFVLLLALIYPRRFMPRFVFALVGLSILPFVLQSPDYVLRQYELWWQRVSHNDVYRRFWPLPVLYRDVWLLTRVWGIPITVSFYTWIQLAGAALCGLIVVVARWRLGVGKKLLFVLLSSTTIWILILGPSTESCTYSIFAPILAWWLVRSHQSEGMAAHYPAVFAYGLLLICLLAGTHTRGIALYHVPGLQPIAVLSFALGSIVGLVRWCVFSERAEREGESESTKLFARAA